MYSVVRRGVAGMAAAVLVGVGLTGCGGSSSSSPSAQDKVCTAGVDVRDALGKVADDVKAGNLGDAKKALTGVRTAVDDLKSAVAELGAQERDKLQPQVDQIRTDLDQVRSAATVSAVQAAAAKAATDLGALVSSIETDLSCSA